MICSSHMLWWWQKLLLHPSPPSHQLRCYLQMKEASIPLMIFSSDTKCRRWWQMDAVSGSQSPVTDYGNKKQLNSSHRFWYNSVIFIDVLVLSLMLSNCSVWTPWFMEFPDEQMVLLLKQSLADGNHKWAQTPVTSIQN